LDKLAASAAGRRWLAALAAIPLVLSFVVYAAPLIPAESGGLPWQGRYHRARRLGPLMDALNAAGITHAYAAYNHAATLTVLSGGRIKVRQVKFTDGLPVPEPLLSYEGWYTDAGPEPTALLVDLENPPEAGAFSLDLLRTYVGPPEA